MIEVSNDVLPSGFDIYVGLEAEASALRSYETDVVHGLLQTTGLRRGRPARTAAEGQRGADLTGGGPADAAAAAAGPGSTP